MTQILNKHKNHITAISGLLIILGITLGFAGYVNIEDVTLIVATIIASIPISIKVSLETRLVLCPYRA